jgi:hypothetical protein
MRIISLTSIPPRFDHIGPTLDTLLRQREPVDEIHLYIPRTYRRFPDYDGRLPRVPAGITIKRVDEDFGPASKILHAVRAFRGRPETEILFCDDDRLYAPDWAGVFFAARKQAPDAAIAPISYDADMLFESRQANRPMPRARHRTRITHVSFQLQLLAWTIGKALGRNVEGPSRKFIKAPGYRDIFQGYGGVLVRPGFFDDDVFDIPPVMWAVDDIWLSGMLAKAGTPIWAPANITGPRLAKAHEAAPLYAAVLDGADRSTADWTCFRHMQQT